MHPCSIQRCKRLPQLCAASVALAALNFVSLRLDQVPGGLGRQLTTLDLASTAGTSIDEVETSVAETRDSDALRQGTPDRCDVLVAGGSTAALSAAITAAEVCPACTVCLTEPTDWIGGQLVSVPAIDFGAFAGQVSKQGASFRSLMSYFAADPSHRKACWVSSLCYPPALVLAWFAEQQRRFPRLILLNRTTVAGVARGDSDTALDWHNGGSAPIRRVRLVRRRAKKGYVEWTEHLSSELTDWYSGKASTRYAKVVVDVSVGVVVEASELGDVLLTAGAEATQGVEIPLESSLDSDDQCGQSATLPFFMEYVAAPAVDPSPGGSDEGIPFWDTECCCPGGAALPGTSNCSWDGVWSYRRITLAPGGYFGTANVGDVSMQNWGHGNDLNNGNLLAPLKVARASVAAGLWAGGVTLTTLARLEARSYGWFRAYAAGATVNPEEPGPPESQLVLNRMHSGTVHGLTKFPYLRDTRRAVGLEGFRMDHTTMDDKNGTRKVGYRFSDTVALGSYAFDIHPGDGYGAGRSSKCKLPSYLSSSGRVGPQGVPFYVPFRALTVRDVPNMLTAGKTMAMTFWANTAAREHPGEWNSGVAAGSAAALMVARGWASTADALAHVGEIAAVLSGSAIQQALSW